MKDVRKRKLVILGSGFGSFRLAMGISTRRFEVTIVSPRDHFLFTPLLASTTVGTTEFRSIIEPLRGVQKGIRTLTAWCEGIDPEQKEIVCRSVSEKDATFKVPYDELVIGVGASSESYNVPGVDEFALMLKELGDARAIRQKIISCVERAGLPDLSDEERARLLHFVVVGGGPTGVEFAGELHDFITEDLQSLFPELSRGFKITLLDAGPVLLSSFDRSLGEYAQRIFSRRKIEVKTSSFVKEVREKAILLSDGISIPYGLLVWSAGVGPTSLVKSQIFEKDKSGKLLTDERLKVLGQDSIYAIGDCASVKDRNYPMTGQLAQQQGKYLARCLNRSSSKKAFRYLHLGMLAYIGGNKALADTPGIKWRGFVAWLMWRSVYVTKLVRLRNKIRVLFDWFRTSIFGRDVATF